MDWGEFRVKWKEAVSRYKFAAVVLLVGLALLLLPSREPPKEAPAPVPAPYQDDQQRLEALLSRVEGAGKVQVLLTQAAGPQTWYQTDMDKEESQDRSSQRSKTVVVTDPSRAQTGLIRQVIPPTYLGAVILCQGAENAQVRLSIIEAVADATGLGTDRISVLKMK